MKEIINMTPHPIHIVDEEGQIKKTFESEGEIRLTVSTDAVGEIGGIKTTKTVFGEPTGLPEEKIICGHCRGLVYAPAMECDCLGFNHTENVKILTYYIVSQLVKNALPERRDLLVPAEVVRDDKGRIIGCKSLGI